jgi:methylmalonyl-CoA mutase, N-terminal domain
VLAYESGVTGDVDPFGGAYFVEKLTCELEQGVQAYFDEIDRMGGMVAAIERGFPQKEIAESSYRFQQAVERKEKIVVGVNDFVATDEPRVPILYIDEGAADAQLARLRSVRASRDAAQVADRLARLETAAAGTGNMMPSILEAVRAYATLGEMCNAMRVAWGEYEETPVI